MVALFAWSLLARSRLRNNMVLINYHPIGWSTRLFRVLSLSMFLVRPKQGHHNILKTKRGDGVTEIHDMCDDVASSDTRKSAR